MKTFVQIYNPREDSADVLRELFIGREHVLREILDDLRRQMSSKSRQHWMVRAPRGHGKTHLAAMIYHCILADPSLGLAYQPVWLSEAAAYEVYSAGSFLERIASELVQELASNPRGSELRQELEELHGDGDDPHFFDAALELLKSVSKSMGKTLVVLVENFDSLLNGFSPKSRKAEAQRLRSMMQHDHEFLFVGTTPTHYLPGLSDPKKPLWGQFRERRLDALTEAQTEQLFDRLADTHGQSEKKGYLQKRDEKVDRRRVFHRLTGGSPRSVVMLFHVVTSVPGIQGLVNDLRSLLDVHTAYFEARLAKLAPRERVIIAALSSSDENLTAQELARRTRLPERSISTQLHRLVEEGHVVEAAGAGGKGTVYEVADGMLRLWHQFRKGRKLLEPVVRFLSYWHSPEELAQTITLLAQQNAHAQSRVEKEEAELTLRHVQEAYRFRTSPAGSEQVAQFLAECCDVIETPSDSEGLQELITAVRQGQEGNYQGAIELLERYLSRTNPRPSDENEARASVNLGVSLRLAGSTDRAIVTFRSVIERFAGRAEPVLREGVARAFVGLGLALGETGRSEEAVEAYRSAVARFGEPDDLQLLEQVAATLVALAAQLRDVGRIAEAIETYQSIVSRFSDRQESALVEYVVLALVNLGVILGELGRPEEAIDAYRAADTRFGGRDEPSVLAKVVGGLLNLGALLVEVGCIEQATDVYRSVAARFGERDEKSMLVRTAMALVNLGVTLGKSNRTEEEIEVYRSVVAQFGEHDDPKILEEVARALLNLAITFGESSRRTEEIETYQAIVERFGDSEHVPLLEQVARSLFNLGCVLLEAGRTDKAIDIYRSMLRRFGGRREAAILGVVAKAQYNLGVTFARADRTDEAVAAYRSAIAHCSDREEPELLQAMAKALGALGVTLAEAGRREEAVETLTSVVRRFGDRDQLAFAEPLARASLNLGLLFRDLGRIDDAIDAYDSLITRFRNRDESELCAMVAIAYQALLDLVSLKRPERARPVAVAAIAYVAQRGEHVASNTFLNLMRSLLLAAFDEADLRRWMGELEGLERAPEIAEIARLHRFVVDVLEASGTKARNGGGLNPKARRERALGRVPSQFRQSVMEMVDDILRARRERERRARKKRDAVTGPRQ